MARYGVYRLPDGMLVLDLQSDLIDTGARVVAPLVPVVGGPRPIGILEPVVEVEGEAYALHTGELAAVPARLVAGTPVASLAGEDYAIGRALDMLFTGI